MHRPTEGTTPAEARRTIIDDHKLLSAGLDELDALIEGATDGIAHLGRRLRERGLTFFERFAAHLDLEEALLLAPLRNVESGDLMADRLVAEHREQREQIRRLLDMLTDTTVPVAGVAEEVRSFVRLVRIDMEHEETTILRKGLIDGA